jgi:hypothetical protein
MEVMNECQRATKVIEILKAAEHEPAQLALPMLNKLLRLARADQEQPLEIEETRADAFLAICEIGKALHHGHPAVHLWALAIGAAERWMSLSAAGSSR